MIKILAVDDEPGICNIIKKTFSSVGFTVLVATDAEGALAIIKKEKPKIVFLDVKMPGMSGLEALAQIKKFDQSIKVIMLTVRDDDSTRQEARRLGADEFVTKPFMSDCLGERVR
jgi:DNA-binding response OmpR family regulator